MGLCIALKVGVDYEGPGSGCNLSDLSLEGSIHIGDSFDFLKYKDQEIVVGGLVRYCGGKKKARYICGLTEVKLLEKDQGKNESKCIKEGERGSSMLKENKTCCEGLSSKGGAIAYSEGRCAEVSDMFICIDCPNGECGTGENICNCPDDCANKDWVQFNQQIDFNNPESYKKCNTDDDCHLVKSYKPCLAVEAINKLISEKKWSEYWGKNENENVETLYRCSDSELDIGNSKAVCQDGLCEAIKDDEK
ncbi:hypothetical protein K8R62_01360 [bacterium]|nr:hypothetical protein [bacterium]